MDIFSDSKENFINDHTPEEESIISNRPPEEDEIATGGSPKNVPNPITKEICEEAIKLAESPQGLDIAAFQRKHNIYVMNVDELIKG